MLTRVKSIREKRQVLYEHSTIDDFLWPNRYLLKSIGCWPIDPNSATIFKRFAYFRIVFSIFIIFSTLFIPMILMLIVHWGNLSILTEIGCITITVGQLIFKVLYMVARHKTFCHVYQIMRKFWLITEDEEERENFEQLAKQGKQLTIAFIVTGMSNSVVISAAPILDIINDSQQANETSPTRNLPLNLWYGVETTSTPTFELLFCSQALGMLLGSAAIIGCDSTMMSLILHICGQFRLIRARFRVIGDGIHDLDATDESKSYLDGPVAKIESCIAHHRSAIRIAKEVNRLLSPMIFVQLMTSGLVICLGGYALMVGIEKGNRDEIAQFVIYIVTMFLQLVIWCWPGELLINESTAVGDVICYEIPWYALKVSQQRDLCFIIYRAQKECQVTALGFEVMLLAKLTEVFNTAASYFALLRRVNEKLAR